MFASSFSNNILHYYPNASDNYPALFSNFLVGGFSSKMTFFFLVLQVLTECALSDSKLIYQDDCSSLAQIQITFKGGLLVNHLSLLNLYRVVRLEAFCMQPAAELPFQ